MPENIHDKGYKRVLSRKKNFLSLLRDFISEPWVYDLQEDDLELVDKEFIPVDFREKEADVIYRTTHKKRDIVFYCLMELQSEVDYTMPFRLLVYMVELLKRVFMDTDKDVRVSASFRLPLIIPIVLYNGGNNWTAVKSFKEYLEGYELAGGRALDFSYVLLDVNRYDDEYLLKTASLISSIFVLDKKQTAEHMKKNLKAISRYLSELSQDERIDFTNWLRDVLSTKARDEAIFDEFLAWVKKGENNMVTYALERLLDEIEEKGKLEGRLEGKLEGKLEGRLEGRLEVAQNMLKLKLPIEQISEIAGLPIEDIQKLSAASKN